MRRRENHLRYGEIFSFFSGMRTSSAGSFPLSPPTLRHTEEKLSRAVRISLSVILSLPYYIVCHESTCATLEADAGTWYNTGRRKSGGAAGGTEKTHEKQTGIIL